MARPGFQLLRELPRLSIVLALLLLAACAETADPPGTPDSGYSEEEIGLLRLTARQIVDLEKEKGYKAIYREYASKGFKERVDLRKFLKLANCTETHLGDFQSYERSSMTFTRKSENGEPVELLNLEVNRANAHITERFVFVQEGLGFKVKSFRWLSTNPAFLGCLESISRNETPSGVPQVEVKVAPGSQGANGE